ncbi:MAG: cell division protein FtsW [Eubacterium sp.]|nr:cell division protein FtsW [Eubacterium sp.]
MPKSLDGFREKKKEVFFDYSMLAVVIILICFGLVMLYSASAYEAANDAKIGDDMFYFSRQAVNSLLAIGAALLFAFIDYHILIKIAPVIYVAALAAMAAVRFSPYGLTVNGATRWLQIGSYSFQPSEIAKIALILMIPFMVVPMRRKLNSFGGMFVVFLVGLVQAVAAYIFTENLSTAIIILAICAIVVFLAHPRTAPFLVGFGLLTAAGGGLLAVISKTITSSSNFRMRRILAWLHPEDNLSTGGYQVMQALYAIGSGGLFGKGLGNSTQKLSTIPEAQNDMIFSIICEELGLFGAILILILFGYLLYRLFYIARNAPDLYGSLLVSGIFVHIALQVILNISVNLNLIPTTGVTLPFVSYGGTSIIFTMIEIGMALNVARSIRTDGRA